MGTTQRMKLIVFGASGLLGTRLVTEALDRGHEVTAVARDASRLDHRGGRVRTASADATDPAEVAAVAGGHDAALAAADALDAYREADTDVDWAYVRPGALLAPGERTGRYRLGTDDLLVDGDGRSHISMEDFAIAMLDEAENPRHHRQRFTAAY